jgi:hypothetical protein
VGKNLLQIVAAERLLSEERLAAAHEQAKSGGEPLAVVLVELEHVNESALAEALAQHLKLPLVEISPSDNPETDALRLVSYDTARLRRVVPLTLETPPGGGPRVLRVAMVDPTDLEALQELESSTGCKIDPVIASLAGIDDALRRVYHGLVTAVMAREVLPDGHEPPPKRIPFGGNLSIVTPGARAVGPAGIPPGTAHAATMPGVAPQPFKTEPYHNVEEQAPIELRFRALLNLLADRGLVSQEDYWTELRKLLKDQS